jgi:AcrR family transcriptional regulator
MARRPRPPSGDTPNPPNGNQPSGNQPNGNQRPGASPRQRIVAALMALLAENPIEQIGLSDVAARAGVSLSELRNEFGSLLAILAAHVKEIDRIVLDGIDASLAEEPARERLFDVLMRRLEALAPYRAAVRSLMRSAVRHPSLGFALNGLAVRSQRWMLTAANIDSAGPKGMVRAQGLALLFGCVLRTFVDDDPPARGGAAAGAVIATRMLSRPRPEPGRSPAGRPSENR